MAQGTWILKSLRGQYVQGGWLEHPHVWFTAGTVALHWSQTIVSLQTLLALDLTIGGRTALVLRGFSHYLAHEAKAIHLYGPKRPPSWLGKLPTGISFVYHNSERLFQHSVLEAGVAPAQALPFAVGDPFSPFRDGWARSLALSQPERALLELLDELPNRESFPEVDKLTEGLANLRPRRLQELMVECRSIEVKRLFFFFCKPSQAGMADAD